MKKFWIKMNMLYERCLFILFFIFLLFGLYYFCDAYYLFQHADNNDLLKYKPSASNYDAAASPITNDMVGWLTINNTNIDYPVMQAETNTKYLNTDPYGQYSLSGSVFLDYRNDSEFSDDYSILYAHHMEYGKMFGALDNYLDKTYMTSHQYGTLLVGRNGQKSYTIKIFAAMKGSARNKIIFEPTERNNIFSYIKSNAVIFTEERNDRILAMSTCSEDDSVTRILVFAYILE